MRPNIALKKLAEQQTQDVREFLAQFTDNNNETCRRLRTSEDVRAKYYLAVGFFMAKGYRERDAHILAERTSILSSTRRCSEFPPSHH